MTPRDNEDNVGRGEESKEEGGKQTSLAERCDGGRRTLSVKLTAHFVEDGRSMTGEIRVTAENKLLLMCFLSQSLGQ